MLDRLFPMSQDWSWVTFILYFLVAVSVTALCKSGAEAETIGMSKLDINFRYFSAYLILVLLATLRSEYVGSDTANYVNYFENATKFSFDWDRLFTFQQMEPGFKYYLYLIRQITDNYTVYFFITYSIVAYGYIAFIKYFFNDGTNCIFLQLFIIFYASNMSGARSALGTFFLLFSFIALDKKKYLRAIILTLIACGFHYTMMFNFFVIIMCWILMKKTLIPNKHFWVLALIIAIVFSGAGAFFLKGIFAETKYDYYSSVSSEKLSLLGSVFYLLYFIICIGFYDKLIKEKQSLLIITLSLMATYPLLFITGAYRIPNYYALPRLLIWCKASDYLIEEQEGRNMVFLVELILEVIVVLYMLFRFTRSAEDGGFQYQFFWN